MVTITNIIIKWPREFVISFCKSFQEDEANIVEHKYNKICQTATDVVSNKQTTERQQ